MVTSIGRIQRLWSKLWPLCVAGPCLVAIPAFAEEAAHAPAAAPAAAPTPAPADATAPPAKAAFDTNAAYRATNGYVHNWIKFPELIGTPIGGMPAVPFKAPNGQATVVFFIASWCEPCQRIIADMQALEKKYENLHTQFIYVFAHDTKTDATGFAQEYGINKGLVGNTALLMSFHNPELPSIYMGDRHGWLLKRWIKSEPKDLDELDQILKIVTSY